MQLQKRNTRKEADIRGFETNPIVAGNASYPGRSESILEEQPRGVTDTLCGGAVEREVWKCFVPLAPGASVTLAVLLGAPLCHMAPSPTYHLLLPRAPSTCYSLDEYLLPALRCC